MTRMEVYDKSPRLFGSDLFGHIFVKADLPAPQRRKGYRMTNDWHVEMATEMRKHRSMQRKVCIFK